MPDPFDNYPGGGRELIRRLPTGEARKGYGRDVLRYCGYRCAYCGLDMGTFDGWLQLSVDHVIPQQMTGKGYPPDWVLDESNVVVCCRSCNELFNRDPVIGEIPATVDGFFDLRDRVFAERKARILTRREVERTWFEEHVLGNTSAKADKPSVSDVG